MLIKIFVVPRGRVELPPRKRDNALNVACLPISPSRHNLSANNFYIETKNIELREKTKINYSTNITKNFFWQEKIKKNLNSA